MVFYPSGADRSAEVRPGSALASPDAATGRVPLHGCRSTSVTSRTHRRAGRDVARIVRGAIQGRNDRARLALTRRACRFDPTHSRGLPGRETPPRYTGGATAPTLPEGERSESAEPFQLDGRSASGARRAPSSVGTSGAIRTRSAPRRGGQGLPSTVPPPRAWQHCFPRSQEGASPDGQKHCGVGPHSAQSAESA